MPSSHSPLPLSDGANGFSGSEMDLGVHQTALKMMGEVSSHTSEDQSDEPLEKRLFRRAQEKHWVSFGSVGSSGRSSSAAKQQTHKQQRTTNKSALKKRPNSSRSHRGKSVKFDSSAKHYDGLNEISQSYDSLVWRHCTKMDIETPVHVCEHVNWDSRVLHGVSELVQELHERLVEAKDVEDRLHELHVSCDPREPENAVHADEHLVQGTIKFTEGWNNEQDCRCTRDDAEQARLAELTSGRREDSGMHRCDSDSSTQSFEAEGYSLDPRQDSFDSSDCSDASDCPVPPKPLGLSIRAPTCTFAQLAEQSAGGPRVCAETPVALEDSDEEKDEAKRKEDEYRKILRQCSTKPGVVPVLRTGGGSAAMLKSDHLPYIEQLKTLVDQALGMISNS